MVVKDERENVCGGYEEKRKRRVFKVPWARQKWDDRYLRARSWDVGSVTKLRKRGEKKREERRAVVVNRSNSSICRGR